MIRTARSRSNRRTRIRSLVIGGVAFLGVAGLVSAVSGCSSDSSSSPTASTTASASSSANGLSVSQAWVKSASSGMTSAFGTISNDTSEKIIITSATTPAATDVQLHTTTMSGSGTETMKQTASLTVPAHGKLELTPGGNHIMLMNVSPALEAGDTVTFTLHLSDGTTVPFTALVKDYAGAQENYSNGSTATPAPGSSSTSSSSAMPSDMAGMPGMTGSAMPSMSPSSSASMK